VFKKLLYLSGLIVVSLELPAQVRSQIIDDSTKLVYGPKSTLSIREEDVFYQRDNWKTVDTLLTDFHKFTFLEKRDLKWTDLGVIGTAMRPVYHQPEGDIGARPGFRGFDNYFKAPKDFKYFDTKSPYIEFSLMLGGKGRSITNVLVSRNVIPQLNFGLHIQKLTVDKQIGNVIEGDRSVKGTAYDAFGSFHNKKKTYWIMANYSRTRHVIFETGGVDEGSIGAFRDYFDDDAEPVMIGPESIEKRRNIHSYQELQLLKPVKMYHEFDRYYQKNSFSFVNDDSGPAEFFDNFYVDTVATVDESHFSYYKNEGGLKGRSGKLFYNAYYKNRLIDFDYKYIDSLALDFKTKRPEHYIGGQVIYNLDGVTDAKVSMEYLLEGNYKIKASISTKWGEIGYFNSRYQPSFIQRSYFGNHDRWSNDFKDPIFLQVNARGKIMAGPIELRPEVAFTQISHYIFFSSDTIPAQASNTVGYLSPGIDFSVKLPLNFTFQSEIIYTHFLNETRSFVQIPKFLVNGHLYYKNMLFKGALDTQIGAKIYWREDYYADNYYPILQQFFYQDEFKMPTSLKIDLYLSFKVRSALVFFKFVNLKQMLIGEGNLVAPFYPQQRNAFDFGFTWFFYD
jgi:hypothetical protein